ncbi:MAG: RusA family crossover junction endodeoxyribonuclease [Oscillospiraceae bacterium]|nr:RusA family crossover junction endodeoxyribonuclease [Oscillospiraceae bacterium]
MKIVVNAIPPSNNKFIDNSHSFNVYRREKQKWHWLIKAAITEKPPEPIEKAIVRITYFFPDRRRRDPDNYSGKFILDPLTREGIIADDDFKHVRLELAAEVDRLNPRTEIEIVEVSAETLSGFSESIKQMLQTETEAEENQDYVFQKGGMLEQITKTRPNKGICETCGNCVKIGKTALACVPHDKLIIPWLPPFHGNCKCKDWKTKEITDHGKND